MNDPEFNGGRYRLDKFLGQGGVARVFLATDHLSEDHVVLKMAHEGDFEAARAIKSEFRFAMLHRHPSLINPSALLERDGQPVIVMPLVAGMSQDEVSLYLNSPENTAGIRNFIAGILECAAFIHFCGYLYNDFKPSNFIWNRVNLSDGIKPALLDFNLVSSIGSNNPRSGTIEYAAPEILLGETPTPSSDLYSLGVTLFELFAGHPPFRSDENASLIREITEQGALDLSSIPAAYRQALESLLNRDHLKRPQNAASAAEIFELKEEFDALFKSRAPYYLAAGLPPFGDELKQAVMEYLRGQPEKAFIIIGSGQGSAELDYISAELSLDGYRIERLWKSFSQTTTDNVLNYLYDEPGNKADLKTVLAIDDLSSLSPDQRARIRSLLRQPRSIPIISTCLRWTSADLPCQIYDPQLNHSALSAAEEVMSAYLKGNTPREDLEALGEATGGDPELISLRLLSCIGNGIYNPLTGEPALKISKNELPEIKDVLERALRPLTQTELDLLSLLAAWGVVIPMILLAEFSGDQMNILDSLINGGYLRRNKDSLNFQSGDFQKYIYGKIRIDDKRIFHRFWAEAAERYLADSDELLEAAALHWGGSDDPHKGFEANNAAAKEYLMRSELIKANFYAETLLELAEGGYGSLREALMLSADILKQAGAYPDARERYLNLLSHLKGDDNKKLKAETYKDLGDLYRATKKTGRALYYTAKALALFEELGYEQGIADCHNNNGLIRWVSQEYEKALQSFYSAFEVNKRLNNYLEQGKIQSNIGIIKDILGRTSEVADHFEAAYADAQLAADFRLESLIANNLGYFYIRQNKLPRAKEYLSQALEISQKIGYAESTINALSNLGLCDLKSGDLSNSIEHCQRAMQMAKEIGNKHLALDARLFLTEIGILMGNFALSDDVLNSLEKDEIYENNAVFARQVDIQRSRWYHSIGSFVEAGRLARRAAEYAKDVGDTRLKLEAELALLSASLPDAETLDRLARLADEASELGHHDLADDSALVLVRQYQIRGDYDNSEAWLQRAAASTERGLRPLLEQRLLQGKLRGYRKQYDLAIEFLAEAETEAAGNGLLPHALEAVINLAGIYHRCGKIARTEDLIKRADMYIQKIAASLTDSARLLYNRQPLIGELENLRGQLQLCAIA